MASRTRWPMRRRRPRRRIAPAARRPRRRRLPLGRLAVAARMVDGIEWDPRATASTNGLNADAPPFRGRYFTASDTASAMESWLASMLAPLVGLEARRGWSRPLTFTNWLTAVPLKHPDEPLAQEDAVSIDAMHIRATA